MDRVCGCGKVIDDSYEYDGEQYYCEDCLSQSRIGERCKYTNEYCSEYRELCEKMPCNRVLLRMNITDKIGIRIHAGKCKCEGEKDVLY